MAEEISRSSEDSSVVIAVRGLVKDYDTLRAVDGLDLELRSGVVLGLLGPNGAGKTTAMRMMSGIIPRTEGTVEIAGIDLFAEPKRAKRHLAFVPDTPQFFDYLTVDEHLRFIGRLHGLEDIDQRIEDLTQMFELSERRRHLPQTLSRGMRQKLAICMGFLHDPAAVFLDEPLTGLDPLGIRRMKDAIVERARVRGAAVVVSSHQLELVEEISDEILVLDRGRTLVRGSLDDVRTQLADEGLGNLESIFLRLTAREPAPRRSADDVAG